MDWEAAFLLYIQENIRSDILTPLLTTLTHTGDKGIIWIAMCVLMVIIPKSRKFGIIAGASLALEAIIVNIFIKNAVARTRPYDAIEGLVSLVEKQVDYSFPSGHTGAAFAVAGAFLMIAIAGLPVVVKSGIISRTKTSLAYKIFTAVTIVFSFIIAFSRLYVGVHYPTDVLGGFIIGIASSIIAYFGYQIVIKKISQRKQKEA
jgi:undecaprenyl-diphosphatase